ncbi:MAG: peptide chain release factor N(5)-glutamine methyltransferase [Chloroflexi bacterium]|nr:peptide chain release factor N(5)-glutamine methyltransferase [Chloroflexota bacterium]
MGDSNGITRKEALRHAMATLDSHGIPDAPLEAEILLMAVLGVDRERLYSRDDGVLSHQEARSYEALLYRRLKREPTAYILGFKEFYGLRFQISPQVLIPRPETELLVEKAIDFLSRHFSAGRDRPLVADVGTGCGAMAVTLAYCLPYLQVYATDISQAALEVATQNRLQHGLADRVRFLQGDLLAPVPEPVDLIVANLPYVKIADFAGLAPELSYEPRLALAAGPQGLDAIAALLAQASRKLRPKGAILLEIGQDQGTAVAEFARLYFHNAEIRIWQDLGGQNRVVEIDS